MIVAGLAYGDNPTVRIRGADQARAVAALLRRSDFGAGWQGGRAGAAPLRAPRCPGFDPKESDLVVSGHADARFTLAADGVVLEQDVEVLASAAAVRGDFARTIRPQFPACLAYELQHSANVVSAAVGMVPFPPTGAVSAAYRATVVVHRLRLRGVLVNDFVYFAKGRLEFLLDVSAPLAQRDQLGRFELALAEMLLKRAAGAQA